MTFWLSQIPGEPYFMCFYRCEAYLILSIVYNKFKSKVRDCISYYFYINNLSLLNTNMCKNKKPKLMGEAWQTGPEAFAAASTAFDAKRAARRAGRAARNGTTGRPCRKERSRAQCEIASRTIFILAAWKCLGRAYARNKDVQVGHVPPFFYM